MVASIPAGEWSIFEPVGTAGHAHRPGVLFTVLIFCFMLEHALLYCLVRWSWTLPPVLESTRGPPDIYYSRRPYSEVPTVISTRSPLNYQPSTSSHRRQTRSSSRRISSRHRHNRDDVPDYENTGTRRGRSRTPPQTRRQPKHRSISGSSHHDNSEQLTVRDTLQPPVTPSQCHAGQFPSRRNSPGRDTHSRSSSADDRDVSPPGLFQRQPSNQDSNTLSRRRVSGGTGGAPPHDRSPSPSPGYICLEGNQSSDLQS